MGNETKLATTSANKPHNNSIVEARIAGAGGSMAD
jgi:hypothetical protein